MCIYMNASSLKEAGVYEEDIPTILDACDKLRCSRQQLNPTLGTITYYGNEASTYNVYIPVSLPPWGESPRKLATDLKSPGAEKKEKIEHDYRHIFDDDNKKLYCWNPWKDPDTENNHSQIFAELTMFSFAICMYNK